MPLPARVGGLVALCVIACVLVAMPVSAAVLFEKPLHLTRQIDDPISGRAQTVEEYYLGNRAVTISGSWVVIVDYDRSELTEINRAKGAYSTTSFATVAASRPHRAVRRAESAPTPRIERTGSDHRAGRSVELYSANDPATDLHAEIAVDQNTALKRDAFDVVVGAAHPNDGTPASDLARAAARRADDAYGLPLEQTMQWRVGDQTIVATNRVTRVGDELAPADVLAIPPGAQRVDSMIVRAAREAEKLDVLPSNARP